MGLQIKAFALLFVVLIVVDAFAYHGEYRHRVVHGITSTFGSMTGLGPGGDWSRPKQRRGS